MSGENKITVTQDSMVPMARIQGHPLIDNIRLGDRFGYGPEVTFLTSGGVGTPQTDNGLIARKKAIVSRLRDAKIAMQEGTNVYFVCLENVEDLPRALETLGFDKASANEVIVLSQRQVILHQKAQIADKDQHITEQEAQIAQLREMPIDKKSQSNLRRLLKEKDGTPVRGGRSEKSGSTGGRGNS